ncbi:MULTISPECIES: tetratricopeptide repeat protein [Rhizobium]|uniref:tetratricopeptide repeat protein n=1 Tax=Rhizobium TaxID=379 RepID=UPI00036C8A39|nr:MULTISPECIES: tetratricopeptide repeat protein [Rhizobium]TBD89435.1 tetratricopeptide repeat protein [Rhizobium ruizarguesonis]UFW79627.1 tetratricopeptide repeat protein [Rhizobium leguminosarum bv. viciae]
MNEWDVFKQIKIIVTDLVAGLERNQAVNARHVDAIMDWMRKYYRLQPSVPDVACSAILGQLTKVGPYLPKFPDIISWVGTGGLRSEDWKPNEFEGKMYPSLAIKIARALCKWVKTHSDASNSQTDMALEWAERVREKATGDDALWLNWDVAILLRRRGEFQRAAELLSGVIKSKRNEFWVWAEAGRLYQSEQSELALACFCRALECPAEPKFLVRAHEDLAELLASQDEYAQASLEINTAIAIREAEGWPLGRKLEGLLAKPWYDPSAEGAEEPKPFYARHSSAALALCFDVVETKAATCLGVLVPHSPAEAHPDRRQKLLMRFAIRDDEGVALSMVSPKTSKMRFEAGSPLTLLIGRQHRDDRRTIIHVATRGDGTEWDCLEPSIGVVVREATDDNSMKVFVDGTGAEAAGSVFEDKSLRIGDCVRFGVARNPKNDRLDAFNVKRHDSATKSVRLVQGQLRRNDKGFAFIDDVFVAPFLVDSVDSATVDVTALAVFGKHPSKGDRTWRAISLNATPPSV